MIFLYIEYWSVLQAVKATDEEQFNFESKTLIILKKIALNLSFYKDILEDGTLPIIYGSSSG
jgi:hypothetical protein